MRLLLFIIRWRMRYKRKIIGWWFCELGRSEWNMITGIGCISWQYSNLYRRPENNVVIVIFLLGAKTSPPFI